MTTLGDAKSVVTLPGAGAGCPPVSLSSERFGIADTGIGCDGVVGAVRVEPTGVGRKVVDSDATADASFAPQNSTNLGVLAETAEVVDSDEKDMQNGDEKKTVAQMNSDCSIAHDSDRKIKFCGSGISLFVEVHGSLVQGNGNLKKCGYEVDKGSVPVALNSLSRDGEKGGMMENQEEDGDGTNGDNAEEDEDEGEGLGCEEHKYSVGDFVWGKIRSHPWWPGQIYDSSDASEFAAKYSQKDSTLVAYFGDGSFSWCPSSQLKPFLENFEVMSKQSTARSFVNAVQEAVNEIGRLMEFKITRSYFSDNCQTGLTRSFTINAGIKAGVLVPEVDPSKLSLPWYEPAKVLAYVRNVAWRVSISSVLELALMKSWLSAFYRANNGFLLAVYHEPQLIEGLEDKNRSELINTNNFDVPLEVPVESPLEEDWLSLPVGPGFSQGNSSMISDEKIYKRRKQKSVAQIMKEDEGVHVERKNINQVKEGTNSGKLTSRKKKRKGNDDPDSDDGNTLKPLVEWKKGRTNAVISESHVSTEKVTSSVRNCNSEKKVVGGGPVLRECEKPKDLTVEIGNRKAKEQIEEISTPRERKKSKYLSPPYTISKGTARSTNSRRDLETKPDTVAKLARIGERMTKAASQDIGSPRILKYCAEMLPENQPEEFVGGGDVTSTLSSQAIEQDKQRVMDRVKINSTAKEVLSGVKTAALYPCYLSEPKSFDMITGFISSFRNSVYMDGSNYNMYLEQQPVCKRSLDPEPGVQGKDLCQSSEHGSQTTGHLKKKEMKSNLPEVKQGGRTSGREAKLKKAFSQRSPAVIIAVFPPNFPLPSKDDLVRIFSKFGDLNVVETSVSYKASHARIAFASTSNAEEVFKLVVKNSPFGDANVKYSLRNSRVSRAQETLSPLDKTPETAPSSQVPGIETHLGSINKKLEKIKSILGNCDDRNLPEMKLSLVDEVKELLEKVSTIGEPTFS